MREELNDIELTKEDLKQLSAEELADVKIELEELIMDCEEILQNNSEEENL